MRTLKHFGPHHPYDSIVAVKESIEMQHLDPDPRVMGYEYRGTTPHDCKHTSETCTPSDQADDLDWPVCFPGDVDHIYSVTMKEAKCAQ